MSTYFNDIKAALANRLDSTTDRPPIDWENYGFSPADLPRNATDLFLRETLLPAATDGACLFEDGLERHSGIYQVDVFIPEGEGRSTWPDTIATRFKRGTILTYNGINVRIVISSQLPGARESSESNYYIKPIQIEYEAFTPARS